MIIFLSKKILDAIDVSLISLFVIAGVLLAWVAKFEMTAIRIIQFLLLAWFMGIFTKGFHLLQFMATVDIDLTSYIGSKNIQLPFVNKNWKYYLKKSYKRSVPVSVTALSFVVAGYILHVPVNIFKDVLLLFLFIYIVVYGLTTAVTIIDFIEGFLKSYKDRAQQILSEKVIFTNKKIKLNIREGFIFGFLYIIVMVSLFEMSMLHYFLHYIAFSVLYSLTKILIRLYRYFFSAVHSVLGVEFSQLMLTVTK